MMKAVIAISLLPLLIPFTAFAADFTLEVRLGIKDKESMAWDGGVELQDGQILGISGLRFAGSDAVEGNTWKARTRPAPRPGTRSNNAAKAAQLQKAAPVTIVDIGVAIQLADVSETSRISVRTTQGEFGFTLGEAPFGGVMKALGGAAEVRRIPAATALTEGGPDDDYPALAAGNDGAVYAAYTSFTPGLDRNARILPLAEAPADFSFLATPPGGDRIWLRTGKGGKWGAPMPVTGEGRDVYRCGVAVDGSGVAWVIWSERGESNFDIWARPLTGDTFGEPVRLTNTPGNDISPVVATDGEGKVWAAWQGARDGRFRIFESHQTGKGEWSEPRVVSASPEANCWMPAIAGNSEDGGGVAIAWDTYEKGDYDIWLREFNPDGQAKKPLPVAVSEKFEVNSSLTYDREGRLWVGWEIGGPMWAKDYGTDPLGKGVPLDLDRQIGLRVRVDGEWMKPAASHAVALPAKGTVRLEYPAPEPDQIGRIHTAVPEKGAVFNKMGNLACDAEGRIWLFVRNRAGGTFADCVGRFWTSSACYFDGESWAGPIALPDSGDTSHKRPALAAAPGGGLVFVQPTDHRDVRKFDCKPQFSLAFGGFPYESDFEGQSVADVFDTDIYAGRIEVAGGVKPFALSPVKGGGKAATPSEATLAERAGVARCRDYRIDYRGEDLRILRGEFHRHTEASTCSITDGTLDDMWRYALDSAAFDWIGNGDHDNGGGREYPWWIIQKMTDAYHMPGHFDPLFSYERSFNWPEGHRNILFVQRGVRTLPRLMKSDPEIFKPSPDTNMLYAYLKQFDGICAAHTSATTMGTDWRNNDPEVEPMVEIYQGCRQSYERPGAPRAPSPELVEPYKKGFVNLALNRTFRTWIGFFDDQSQSLCNQYVGRIKFLKFFLVHMEIMVIVLSHDPIQLSFQWRS